MPQRGINRITLAVWDLEKGKEFYGKLLGAEWHSALDEDAEQFGVAVAMAWNAGIELVAPLPDRESNVRAYLEKHGEGLMGAVFAVPDVDASRDAAVELGIPIYHQLDYDQATIDAHLQGRFTKYKEYFLGPHAPLPNGFLIGEFIDSEPNDG